MGPNGNYTPSTRLMVQLYGRCLGKVFTFFFSNTYLNSWYWEQISCGHGLIVSEGET